MMRYKKKLSREQASLLFQMLNNYCSCYVPDGVTDRMHIFLLMEISNDIVKKLADRFKRDVSINWKSYEAMAMQLFFFNVIDHSENDGYMHSVIMNIMAEIDRMFC